MAFLPDPPAPQVTQAVLARPSVPAARAYLLNGRAVVRMQYNGMQARRNGYAIYFTVRSVGDRSASMVKVCEDRGGRVMGSSNMSLGEASC